MYIAYKLLFSIFNIRPLSKAEITEWWLLGGLPSDDIGLSIGPNCLYKQKLNFGKVPSLDTWPMRFTDSGVHVTIM